MKVLELRLVAFGPFTNRVLDLGAGAHGLHVLFGPNEAGKSCALRALEALLYGIPGQTSDAFVHPYESLRLGGHLRRSTGEELTFIRRKGNKGTLLTPEGARLDDRALDSFLSGISADQFRMFWGIDHARLVQGGRQILEGHGDLGEALFAAGSGASHLRALRAQLHEEADALFAPRAQKRLINQSIGRLKELQRAQREVMVPADEWARQDGALRAAEELLTQLAARMQTLSRERAQLERLKRVLPLLAERSEIRGRLADLRDVMPLAAEFSKRRQDAEGTLRRAQDSFDRVAPELREQEALLAELGSTPRLVAESEAVRDLYQRLGSHRKAFVDRPGLIGRRDDLRAQAKRLLAELRPDADIEGAQTLRLLVGRRTRIRKLAAERERLEERLALARQRYQDARDAATALDREATTLPAARDADELVIAIEGARRRGDAEARQETLVQAVSRMVDQRDAAMQKLRLPASLVNALEALPVPAAAVITRFERTARDLDDEARIETSERDRLGRVTRELGGKIDGLRAGNAVPTEDELVAARRRRDSAFALLRDQWERGRDVTAEAHELLGDGVLIDLYPGTVQAADDVGDRLRSEAGRVAELTQHLKERERLLQELDEVDRRSRRRAQVVETVHAAWLQAWQAVLAVPPSIEEGRTWCEDFERLLECVRTLIEMRQELEALNAWIDEQVKRIRAVMIALEPTSPVMPGLAAAVTAADKLRQRIETETLARREHARRTRETDQAVVDAEKAVRDALAEIETWRCAWIDVVQGITPGDALPPPDDALVALDTAEKVLRALEDASGYEERIAGIDRDAEAFGVAARALAEQLGEVQAIEIGSEQTWVEALHGRLAAALTEEERRRQARDRLKRLQANIVGAHEAVASAQAALLALRAEARCGPDDDLHEAEQRSADLRRWSDELAQIEKNLLRSGDGASIADLEAEAAGADRDGIEARLGAIAIGIEEVERELAEAHNARANAQAELRRFHGPSTASDKAEEVQATIARLRDDVVRYSRLRVAATLLARRIEDYRRKNQAPLLKRAGELFREMTLGGFERLEADVEDDSPLLVGVRAGGTRVGTAGMSEGTVDQLFLALRLASVEASCETGEPMPFVVDDVLVQFDDDRTAAALQVLASVATRTQVVLFTHHLHVKRIAETLTAPTDVLVHEL